MTPRINKTHLFEGEARRTRRPPGIKSFLITLNIQMDWLLDKIREIESSGDLILCYDENTEIARMVLLLKITVTIGMLDLTSGASLGYFDRRSPSNELVV